MLHYRDGVTKMMSNDIVVLVILPKEHLDHRLLILMLSQSFKCCVANKLLNLTLP